MYGKKQKSTLGGNIKSTGRDVVSECMPDEKYYQEQMAKAKQGIDMLEYLTREDMIDYDQGQKSIGRLLMRIREFKRDIKHAKKHKKEMKKALKAKSKK